MPKTTFRVDTKRWTLFNRECKVSFLRRDSYLNHVLPGELQLLEQLPQNNNDAHQWLKNTWFGEHGRLRTDVTNSVSVMLEKPLIERLNQACDERRIPRDAFIHCVLTFLTERLYEAALVIKDPRTSRDTFWQIADAVHVAQDEVKEGDDQDVLQEIKGPLLDVGMSIIQGRNLDSLRLNFYQEQLSFSPEKLAKAKASEALLETI